MVSKPSLRARFSTRVKVSSWEKPLSGCPDSVGPRSKRATGTYPSAHSSSRSLTVRALVSLSPTTTTGLPQIPSLHIPHRAKPCTRGDRSKRPTKPRANSRRGSLPTISKVPNSEAMALRKKATAKVTAARVPTKEYVWRRSLSAELRPYPGYSPIKKRNPIQTATAKIPTTMAVCRPFAELAKVLHRPKMLCSSNAASQTSTASKASDNTEARTTPGCLQARARRRLGSRACSDGATAGLSITPPDHWSPWLIDTAAGKAGTTEQTRTTAAEMGTQEVSRKASLGVGLEASRGLGR